ncbi:TLDc domain-containing protein [Entamoeba marina]
MKTTPTDTFKINANLANNSNTNDCFSSYEKQMLKSINSLKQWSNKTEINMIYDSDIDGDANVTLLKKVLNKKDLYFITLDENDNIFGGYITEKITQGNVFHRDNNSFNKHYLLSSEINSLAFCICDWNIDEERILYFFGNDLCIRETSSSLSYSDPHYFNYSDHNDYLVSHQFPNQFKVLRIVIAEMN